MKHFTDFRVVVVDLLNHAFPPSGSTATGITGSTNATQPDVMVAALNKVTVTALQPFIHYWCLLHYFLGVCLPE